MPFTPEQFRVAEAAQHEAAHYAGPLARLVAGPGTGKSAVIEERVAWLLSQRIAPDRIVVVSFTRASANELRSRVHRYCAHRGQPAGAEVRVTTLHSLALRILTAAGRLSGYPTDHPMVMDRWELRNVFDAEFGHAAGVSPTRAREVRREHEAFWGTGEWGPANYIPPNPPISPQERAEFARFHSPRAHLYSCVLPGELIRMCVEHIGAGTLDPIGQLGLEHLIVDEFQDLNPCDLQFVDAMIVGGARAFVAGDDDQSIYSFRYALPAGIQNFTTQYPGAASYPLSHCFRCAPAVLDSASTLILRNQLPNRIPKTLRSLYEESDPPVEGIVHRWRFNRGDAEARAIAASCQGLIEAGMSPRDLLVLVSNRNLQRHELENAFADAQIPFEPPSSDGYIDSEAGRLALAALRVVCDRSDYVAHRLILGFMPRVGVGTCSRIAEAAIASNSDFVRLFHDPLPAGVFSGHALRALNAARTFVARVVAWAPQDTLEARGAELETLLVEFCGDSSSEAWQEATSHLPPRMTLEELRDYLWADTDEQAAELLRDTYARIGQPPPETGVLPPRVRMMTMHGAKGLSAKVVFIPGLEESILPGERRRQRTGLVLEAARLLYVSVTRARAACILSYATSRVVHGSWRPQPASQFTAHLGGPFLARDGTGLTNDEIQAIVRACSQLHP